MAAKKPVSYISLDLQWLEESLVAIKGQVDEILNNPVDRRGPKEVASGRIVDNAIIARAEDRVKIAMDLLERVSKMLPAIQLMRQEEDEIKVARGGSDVPHRMKVD